MVNTSLPDPMEQRSRELFNESVERLDARTRSRLNQARQQALNELRKGSTRRYWLGIPLGGLAAAVVVAVVLLSGREPTLSPPPENASFMLDDFDIVADTDSFEMIQDVEFYSWLAEAAHGSANNSG